MLVLYYPAEITIRLALSFALTIDRNLALAHVMREVCHGQ
jgi:hypothetical protein